jgi:hypothetical protein
MLIDLTPAQRALREELREYFADTSFHRTSGSW